MVNQQGHMKVFCDYFKVPYPDENHSKIWGEKLKIINEYQKEYGFGQEIKELFYEFLTSKNCYSICSDRIAIVEKILSEKGIDYRSM